MTFTLKSVLLFTFLLLSCNSGKLDIIADLPNSLKEASAIETVSDSDLLWTIEDSGNKNNIYGLDLKGNIIKDIDITNSSNIDWEDLTSDKQGNLYIGDFGNNSKNRDDFTIYKVSNLKADKTTAERINFILPKKVKPKDFEAFFLSESYFYLFSKENKSSMLFKVPNKMGLHTAKLIKTFNLDGKNHRITSAAISENGKTIVLLNHNKLWKITNFKGDNFLDGTIKELKFEHDSQKEGICFKDNTSVYITDEKNKSEGGNLYTFKIN
ncbi:MAG: SdiA-regulated domain-containing protein [Algibacter sp.]|uniref:SdiA-regulated domain-containing protein n=1 Tax=Algibacter sp. TaxID=1872428 RepID=UPI0026067F6F|nr:SdiA-regulated domain-containing protein [Algibacter sp.]MDG1728990.1 SdiA-regulated domain-containing protein [Algibacter sp.]MDG2179562.1 SdiA-regulated domain-containing protein [Algibacter sp.]